MKCTIEDAAIEGVGGGGKKDKEYKSRRSQLATF